MRSAVCRALIAALCVVLGAFFAFVGWNKAFAPLADLARYHAWTVYLPEWLGRLIGWSEMVLAAGLLTGLHPRLRPVAVTSAAVLIINQFCAAAVHLGHGEGGALPQNAALITALAAIGLLLRRHEVAAQSSLQQGN